MSLLAGAVLAYIGMNVHLPPADTLDLGRELGVQWVRIDFNWNIAEPTQGNYDWAPFDAVIDAAHARGLEVYATVGYGPAWASISNDRNGDGPDNDVPDPVAYARFVRAAAQRYSDGRVRAWGTWNEPNLVEFFEGTRDEWITHAFAPAIDAIHLGCPDCLAVGPELATVGDQYSDYLHAALLSRGDALAAVSMHIYASFEELDPTAGRGRDSFFNKLESHRTITLDGVTYDVGTPSIREVMLGLDRGNIPVWITETGRQAAVDDTAALATQQRYVELVMDAMACRPWWQSTFFYELTEEHPMGLWPDIHWGLALRVADPDDTYADNFQRKPAYDRLRALIAAPPVVDCTVHDAGTDAGTDAGRADARATGDAAPDANGSDAAAGTDAALTADSGTGGGQGGCACRAGAPAARSLRGSAALGALAVASGFARRRRARSNRA